jgi:Ca2+-binding EF-hand superfamily protein
MASIGSIGGTSGNQWATLQGTRAKQKKDVDELAKTLLSKIDTAGQGYIDKAEFSAAVDKISATSSTSGTTQTSSGIDELFAQLDADGDGKITQQELADTMKQAMQQVGGPGGGPPPGGAPPAGGAPPPGGKDDAGFTKDELSAQLEEIGSTDSKRSSLISTVVENFDAADTNGDGKVSFQEATAYAEAHGSTAAASGDGSTASTSASTSTARAEEHRSGTPSPLILQLLHAYAAGEDLERGDTSQLSVSA